MSSTVVACTIIGVEFERGDLFTSREVQDKKHGCTGYQVMLKEGTPCIMRHCPDCGAETVKIEETWADGIDPDDTCGGEKMGPFEVVTDASYPEERRWLSAFKQQVSGYQDETAKVFLMPDQTVMELRDSLRAFMEPLGIWDPDKFGIWTILYYS